MRLSPLVLLLLTGCLTRPVNVSLLPEKPKPDALFGAIPHFDVVDKASNAYRGGQPTKAGFEYLHNVLHVNTIIKLNKDSEGSDAVAEILGMRVVKFPIPLGQQIFGGFDEKTLKALVEENYHDVFIHCEHGQDRTGLAVYYYKRLNLSVPKNAAINDMLSHGFHKALVGLWKAVD